jgi:predicted Rdx family selenoprotein
MSNGEWKEFKNNGDFPDLKEIKGQVDNLISNIHNDA